MGSGHQDSFCSIVGNWGKKEEAQITTKGYSKGQRQNYFEKWNAGMVLFGGTRRAVIFLFLNSVVDISGLSSVWCFPDTQDHPRCPHEANRCDTAPAGLLAFEAAAGDWAEPSKNGAWKGSGLFFKGSGLFFKETWTGFLGKGSRTGSMLAEMRMKKSVNETWKPFYRFPSIKGSKRQFLVQMNGLCATRIWSWERSAFVPVFTNILNTRSRFFCCV